MRSKTLWISAAIIALGFFLAAKKTLGRDSNDFYTYLAAAQDLATGGVNLYEGKGDLSGYSYAHFFVIPFRLLLFLPVKVIAAIWCLGLGIATVVLLRAQLRLTSRYSQVGWLLLIGTPLLFSRTITHNYSTAQASLWIAALAMLGWSRILDGRDGPGGIYLGIAAATKLTPMAYLVVLLWERRWRAASTMVITVLVLVFVLPLLFIPLARHIECLCDFYDAMISPLFGSGRVVDKGIWNVVSASISGTWPALFPTAEDLNPKYTFLAITTVSATTQSGLALGVTGLCSGLAVFGLARARRLTPQQATVHRIAIISLLIALVSPLTRIYHLPQILLAGGLVLMLGRTRMGRGPRSLWWLTLALALLVFPLKQKSIFGDHAYTALSTVFVHAVLLVLLLWMALGVPLAGSLQAAPSPRHPGHPGHPES